MSETSYQARVFTPKHVMATFELVLMPKKVVVWANGHRWLVFGINSNGQFENPEYGLLELELSGVSWQKAELGSPREHLFVPWGRRKEVQELLRGMRSVVGR